MKKKIKKFKNKKNELQKKTIKYYFLLLNLSKRLYIIVIFVIKQLLIQVIIHIIYVMNVLKKK